MTAHATWGNSMLSAGCNDWLHRVATTFVNYVKTLVPDQVALYFYAVLQYCQRLLLILNVAHGSLHDASKCSYLECTMRFLSGQLQLLTTCASTKLQLLDYS